MCKVWARGMKGESNSHLYVKHAMWAWSRARDGEKVKKRAITALALQGVHHFTPLRHTVSVTGNGRKSKSLWMLLEVDGYVWCSDLNIVFQSEFLRSAYANGFTTRRMGLTWSGKYISLFLAVQLGEWLCHGRFVIVLFLYLRWWIANCKNYSQTIWNVNYSIISGKKI